MTDSDVLASPAGSAVGGPLAAVGDADLGQASAINDDASRVGGVIAIAPMAPCHGCALPIRDTEATS